MRMKNKAALQVISLTQGAALNNSFQKTLIMNCNGIIIAIGVISNITIRSNITQHKDTSHVR